MARSRGKRSAGDKKKPTQAKPGHVLIFRRFRTDPRTGKVLDAHWFGLRAWPIWVKQK
jgi:hypothetical protein